MRANVLLIPLAVMAVLAAFCAAPFVAICGACCAAFNRLSRGE